MADKVLSNVTSKDCPTMQQLTKVMRIGHIDIATKWHELGPVLIDSYSVIRRIEADHRNDVTTCCRVMFEKWLERTPDANWDQLVAALNEIDMKTAADVISRQLTSDILVDADNIQSEEVAQFSTLEGASVEFGILLDKIVRELENDKVENLLKLQAISSTLTIHKDSRVHVFTDKKLEEIGACDSIRTLLIYKLRHCYRWDDFAMLTKLISSVKAKECLSMLKKFEIKINSEFKLQQIYKQCKQKALKFPTEYHKFVAIINDKIFSEITDKDYDALKHFVSEQCGVEDYVISPVTKIAISSLILEWYIPTTAVAHMIKIALSNKVNFAKNCFVYLKISSTLILDHRDTTIEQDQLILAAKKGDVVTTEALLNDKYIDVNTIGSHYKRSKKTALHYGSENGHVAVVETLIRAGADVNAVDRLGKTALHYGSENDHAAVVEALISAGADVNAVDESWDNNTALHYVSKNGDVAVVDALIRAGANVNAINKSKKTALHYGSENGHVAVVETLIRAGADVNAVDLWGQTALHYGSENGHVAVVEALIRAGADVNAVNVEGKTALHYGHAAVVEALISAGSYVNAVDHSLNNNTALHYVSKNGDVAVVDALIRAGANVNAINKSKKTALHYGSENGHVAVVETLIRAGADVNAVDRLGKTALHYGSENDHAAVVEALISAGADVNAVDESWDNNTALHYVSKNGDVAVVDALIRAGANVNAINKWDNNTALHYASENGHVAVVDTLIRAGANVNAINKSKKTALHYGSENGHAAVVEALIRAGANVDAVDYEGKTALHYGLKNDHAAVVEALISAGADVNAVGQSINKETALHYASKNGYAAVVDALIRAGADVNAVNRSKKTALHYGSENGHAAVVESLIRAGADVNVIDLLGKITLHDASRNGHAAVVEVLIRAGADVNVIDHLGKTALHDASRKGHAAVVEALIRAGADVNAVDQSWDNNTALHYASENGDVAVVDALIRAGANVNAINELGKTALHYGSKNDHAAVVFALIRAGVDVNVVDEVTKTKVEKIIAKPHIYLPLLSDYDTSSSRSVSSGYSTSSGYGTSSYDSFSHHERLILSHASECSDAKKNILRYHGELRKLPIDLIWDKLLAKKVITHEEKETIATLPLQSDRIKYFLDSIIIPSLNDDKIEKFKGFLHVMKESCDPVLIDFAGKLGGSK